MMFVVLLSLLSILLFTTLWIRFALKRQHVKLSRPSKCSTMIVFGSGGHTSEMLSLLQALDLDVYSPLHAIVASSDNTSLPKAQATHQKLSQAMKVHQIRRSREVGQSWLSSVVTTALASWDAIKVVLKTKPDLLICNGPGTCVPVCVGALLLRLTGVHCTCLVFVESFCRVKTLSMTGKILYYIADRFVVQWPELAEKYSRAEYIGQLF